MFMKETIMRNPFDLGYYTEADLQNAGFKSLGTNIMIAKNCTIIGLENISIDSNVRIDGYSSLIAAGDGWLNIGSYIHISSYGLLSAGDGIELEDFTTVSHGARIYSRSDDYSGEHMTNPTVPEEYLAIERGPVFVRKHAIVGTGCVVMPDLTIGDGAAVGALAFVNSSLDEWAIYGGCPAKQIKPRSRSLLELETDMMKSR